MTSARALGFCCAAIIAALYVVGLVSGTVLRHVVQTAPIWLGVGLAWRGSGLARWMALPFFLFWLTIMTLIWMFLLGWARVVSGHFTPIEVAMTIVIGIAALGGLASAARRHPRVPALATLAVLIIGAFLQIAAFRVSLLPGIASR